MKKKWIENACVTFQWFFPLFPSTFINADINQSHENTICLWSCLYLPVSMFFGFTLKQFFDTQTHTHNHCIEKP